MSEESLYGENAVTGSKEEAADILAGRDVSITSGETKKIEVTDENSPALGNQDEKNPEGDKTESKPTDETAELQENIANYKNAEGDLKKDLSSKGLDFDQITSEFEENGKLSDETMAALDKAGYPKSVVDAYIQGLEATVNQFVQSVISMAGGEAAYEQLQKYILAQGQAAVDTFNKTVEGGDLGQLKAVIDGFKSRMVASRGTANRSLLGNNGQATQGSIGFTSKEEMVKAMSDPRYARDMTYTREVQNKVMHASFLG